MSIQEQIEQAGRTIRALALCRQDAAEQHGAGSEAFATLDAEYKAALDALGKLVDEQARARTAAKRRKNPMHGITKG